MKTLSKSTESAVRLGALHIAPVIVGLALLVFAWTGGRAWLVPPAVFLVGEGMYCFGLANGVDMARGNLSDD